MEYCSSQHGSVSEINKQEDIIDLFHNKGQRMIKDEIDVR